MLSRWFIVIFLKVSIFISEITQHANFIKTEKKVIVPLNPVFVSIRGHFPGNHTT